MLQVVIVILTFFIIFAPAFADQVVPFAPVDNTPLTNDTNELPLTCNFTDTNYSNASMSYSCNQIYAVQLGMPVTFSSTSTIQDCFTFRFDIPGFAWSAEINDQYQWVQVTSMEPKLWKGVITRGRSTADEWVEQYKVSYTINGEEWEFVDGGQLFVGNTNYYSYVRNDFKKPVFARAIRVHPTRWRNNISMRVEGVIMK